MQFSDVEELTSRQEQQDSDSDTFLLRASCDELKEIVIKQREIMQRMLQSVQANSKVLHLIVTITFQ